MMRFPGDGDGDERASTHGRVQRRYEGVLSIPGGMMWQRRVDAHVLGRLVAEHRLDEPEAFELIQDSDGGAV